MAIDHARQMQLIDDFLRVTAPSDVPDDNFRPTHWSDRIYYLLRQTKMNERQFSMINWDVPPRSLASDIVRKCAGSSDWFDSLEQVVAHSLEARFGNS